MLPQASTAARGVDTIFFALCGLAAGIILLLFALIVGFALVYRRGSNAKRGPLGRLATREIEIGWTVATLFTFLFLFWWAASAHVSGLAAPKNAAEIHVVAKQWMWKFEHPSGAREINELHLPARTPVRLVMISQDVIHSFFVPAFRVKQDILPGRYTELWVEPTTPGLYRLECAEYCGTDHASMTGRVIVMAPSSYASWSTREETAPFASGAALFSRFGCAQCHQPGAAVRAPSLAGLFGREILLADGTRRRADENYLRRSLLTPNAEIVSGYRAVMPSYRGALSEEEIGALIAYIKALPPEREP
jgi:cytochrome c oxidase subunit 2